MAVCQNTLMNNIGNSPPTNLRPLPQLMTLSPPAEQSDYFGNNNSDMLNEEFRLENNFVFTDVESQLQQPPNQFSHVQMNGYYNTQPQMHTTLVHMPMITDANNMQFQPQMQMQMQYPQSSETNIVTPQIMQYNHNHRKFQYSHGYLNPSHRIHNNIIIPNDRQQRLLFHQQQMRQREYSCKKENTPNTKNSNNKTNTVRQDLKVETANKHQTTECTNKKDQRDNKEHACTVESTSANSHTHNTQTSPYNTHPSQMQHNKHTHMHQLQSNKRIKHQSKQTNVQANIQPMVEYHLAQAEHLLKQQPVTNATTYNVNGTHNNGTQQMQNVAVNVASNIETKCKKISGNDKKTNNDKVVADR
eukprot:82010_1